MARSKPKFEEAMKRVEQIVEAIEQGKSGLEESIAQFEEGMTLIQLCRTILTEAELKIQKLQPGAGGTLEATPLEIDEEQ